MNIKSIFRLISLRLTTTVAFLLASFLVPSSGFAQTTTSYSLTINSGYVPGIPYREGSDPAYYYTPGTVVTVEALSNDSGRLFAGWSGQTNYLADPSAIKTTLVMPAAPVTITATYGSGTTYSLTVTGGSGSGNYAAGKAVVVTANVPVGYQFAGWTGSTTALANPAASTTILTMPTAAAAITAVFTTTTNTNSYLLANDIYRVVAKNSGLALAANGVTDGSAVSQQTYIAASSQQWNLNNLGNGMVSLIVPGTNEALEVPGASTTLGANLDVSAYTGATNQQWTIVPASSGYYEIINVNSGYEANVSYNSTSPGERICQWYAGDYPNGVWSFTSLSGGTGATYSLTVEGGIGSGIFVAGTVVHVAADPVTDGRQFATWTGSISFLADVTAEDTAFTMPAAAATITALYRETDIPPAPADLMAIADNARVALSWTPSFQATSYNVYRGTSAGGENATPIATGITASNYTDTGLTNGTTYYYEVVAVNIVGTSVYSNEVGSTPSTGTTSGGMAVVSVQFPQYYANTIVEPMNGNSYNYLGGALPEQYWNVADTNTGTSPASNTSLVNPDGTPLGSTLLIDSTGADTNLTFTYSGYTRNDGTNNNSFPDPVWYLMGGLTDLYIAAGSSFNETGAPQTLTVSGLDATHAYDLVMYVTAPWWANGGTDSASASAGGITYYLQTSNTLATWTQATSTTPGSPTIGNYILFSNLTGSTSQTVTLTGAYVGLAGFQVIDLGLYSGGNPPGGNPTTYALTVSSGTGNGSYAAGTVVTITANTPDTGYQFAGWTGDTSYLANPAAATTTLTMPALAASVTATYTPITSDVPAAPSNLTVTQNADGSLTYNWQDNSTNETAFTLQYQKSDGSWATLATVGPNQTTYTLDAATAASLGVSPNTNTDATASNPNGTSDPSNQTDQPLPRYALVDLGASFYPVAINSSSAVVGNLASTTSGALAAQAWSQGTLTALPPSPHGPGIATAMDDAGEIVGTALFDYTPPKGSDWSPIETHACYWAKATTDKIVDLDTQNNNSNWHNYCYISGYSYQTQATAISSGGIYGWTQGDIVYCATKFTVSTAEPVEASASLSFGPSRTNSQALCAAGGNWAGYAFNSGADAGHPDGTGWAFIINGTLIPVAGSYQPNTYPIGINAINTNGIALGYQQDPTTGVWSSVIFQGTTITSLPGNPAGTALNNLTTATVITGNPPAPATLTVGPQIVGGTTLWDYTNLDGTYSASYIQKNLNLITSGTATDSSATNPPPPPWHITGVSGINDSGLIVGTATYSPTSSTDSIPAGPHGVLLLPIEIVMETEKGSGQYQALKSAPVYQPDDGIGEGQVSVTTYDLFQVQLNGGNLTNGVVNTLTASFSNTNGSFAGVLTETSSNSGVFSSSDGAFSITLNPATTTTSTTSRTFSASVTASAFGLTNSARTIQESAPGSGIFVQPQINCVVTLSAPLDSSKPDTISCQIESDGFSQMTLIETGNDTKVFQTAAGDFTLTISGYTGLNPDSMNTLSVTISSTNFPTIFNCQLIQISSGAYVFANFSTCSTNATPDDPSQTHHGVFYIKIPGTTSVSITLQTDGGSTGNSTTPVAVDLLPSSDLPGYLLSPPLLMVGTAQSASQSSYTGLKTLQMASLTDKLVMAKFGASDTSNATWTQTSSQPAYLGVALTTDGLGDMSQDTLNKHLKTIDTYLTGMGYGPSKQNGHVIYSDLINSLPNYSILYLLCHGDSEVTSNPEDVNFQGIWLWQLGPKSWWTGKTADTLNHKVTADELSTGNGDHKYNLVFINGCGAGNNRTGIAQGYANALHAKNYVSWEYCMNTTSSAGAAERIFERLKHQNGVNPTVAKACDGVTAYNAVLKGSTDLAVQVPLKLVLQDDSVIIDLTSTEGSQ